MWANQEDTSDGGSYGVLNSLPVPIHWCSMQKRTHAQEAPANGSFNSKEKAMAIFFILGLELLLPKL